LSGSAPSQQFIGSAHVCSSSFSTSSTKAITLALTSTVGSNAMPQIDPAILRAVGGDEFPAAPILAPQRGRTVKATSAAEAVGFGAKPPPRMQLIAWRPLVKGSLRGFATVELPNGLQIFDVAVFANANGAWANLPSKPLLDDGRHKLGADGKPAYAAVLDWNDRALAKRFSQAVVELVRLRHPEALDGVER
jgi:hypothetical protein